MPVFLKVRCATRHRRYPFTGRQTVIQRQVRDQALKVGCLHAQCVQKGGLLGLQKRPFVVRLDLDIVSIFILF